MPLGRRSAGTGTGADLLLVGLGNPGDKYAATRHNAGQWVVEELVSRHGTSLRRSRRERALVAELRIEGRRVVAAVPVTWMNESGQSVGSLVRRHRISDLERLVVAHDELDLAVGRLKVKAGGGIAGHKGLESVRSHLRSDGFTRVRVGVGKPAATPRGGSYVLKRPGPDERAQLAAVVRRAADAVECFVVHGLDETMNRFNGI